MARAKQRDDWDRSAMLRAMIANALSGKQDKPVDWKELNPFRESETTRVEYDITILKKLLSNGRST